MKSEEQLELWVNGKSVHNKEMDECCPDFSCCHSGVNTPVEVRKKFQEADEKTRMGMLGHFLSVALSTPDEKESVPINVYVAGQGEMQ